jgi:predicted RNase H-related nuclease YkuK (DUF458 family)
MRIFKVENGKEGVDVIRHTQEILAQYPDAKIYVGCDSQNKKRGCIYATVIAYRFSYGDGDRHGARYIYTDEWLPKIKDRFTRLWGEVERSVELARWLEEQGFKVHKIDLDFNLEITAGSHNMVAAGSGYVKGFGFDCSCKPEEQIASRAGDHIVKKKKARRWHRKRSKVL